MPQVKTSKYTSHLRDLCELLYGKMGRLIYENNTDLDKKHARAVADLLRSDYILKIKVLHIDSTPNKNSPFDYNRYRVIALVEDTTKSKIFQTNCENTSISKTNSNAYINNCHTISFQYTPHNYRGFGEYSSNSNPNVELLRDSAFTDGNGYYKMSINQEAIVF